MAQRITIDQRKYRPGSIIAKLGYRLSSDSAMELLVGAGLTEKKNQDITVKPANVFGLYYRIGSEFHNRLRTYILAGASLVTLDIEQPGKSDRRDYGALSWGLGAEERLKSIKHSSFSLSYIHFYDEDNVKLQGLSAGFHIDFH